MNETNIQATFKSTVMNLTPIALRGLARFVVASFRN